MFEEIEKVLQEANQKISSLEKQLIIDKSNNENLNNQIKTLEEEVEEHQSNLVLGVESINFIEKTANNDEKKRPISKELMSIFPMSPIFFFSDKLFTL